MTYPDFFKTATGEDHSPYGWQERLATSCTCESRLIDIPTGLGKTAGVILAWLWNRLDVKDGQKSSWPRRLVYCLPMRTLVEQTECELAKWLQNLWKEGHSLGLSPAAVEELRWLSGNGDTDKAYSPIILMGGEDLSTKKREWDLYPERPAILIGTQDMLLSRALNRGYGMSRYRWPMHFSLLNNDALWIMDEVQLMGSGLETSAQMQGLRKSIGTTQICATWWMSATVAPERLKTPDFKSEHQNLSPLQLTSDEAAQPQTRERLHSKKTIHFSDLRLKETKVAEISVYAAAVADQVAQTHEQDSLTLVILNRVDRAQTVFNALGMACPDIPCALIHSRFRPGDRAEHMKLIDHPKGGILVSTQAIEAGLDISARHLFTELAPWSSLVQRMGRCNRDGKQPEGGTIRWIDLHSKDEKKLRELALPYSGDALIRARATLTKITDGSPQSLSEHVVAEESIIRPILRKKDLLDLFDTSPDLAGLDLDVSRYIRDGNDTDVEVFWREIPRDGAPPPDTHQPAKAEICRVSIGAFRSFAKKAKYKRIWRWQGLTGEWEEVSNQSIYPGMTCLVASDLGGYSTALGWTGDPKGMVTPVDTHEKADPFDSNDSDPASLRKAETLETHTAKVANLTETLATPLVSDKVFKEALATAARWHDLGKAHYRFQKMLLGEVEKPESGAAYLAKSETDNKCTRRFFRHELASALGWLALVDDVATPERDLIAYLIAAHHGKVRLSIRAMPNEQGSKADPDRPFARGVWHGEQLPYEGWPAIKLNGETLPPITLDLAPLTVGGGGATNPSWLECTLTLRDRPDLGVFILAYLETLLRAADGRASAQTLSERTNNHIS